MPWLLANRAKVEDTANTPDEVEAISVELIESVGSHSKYRGKELPAYRVVLDHSSGTVIYVSANRGVVTTRRNNRWRVFDFFWMLHTMDYQGRDNFNHWLLKGMSIFGLVTVLSGFVLWFKTTRLFRRKIKSKGLESRSVSINKKTIPASQSRSRSGWRKWNKFKSANDAAAEWLLLYLSLV